jgi:hypothetical protein
VRSQETDGQPSMDIDPHNLLLAVTNIAGESHLYPV